MKILLIKAAYTRNYGQVVPPLGLLYISAALRRAGYNDIKLLHLDLARLPQARLQEEIAAFGPGLVGISAITAEALSMHSTAALVKKCAPGAFVAVGGPHPTGYPGDCLEDLNIDAAVLNEGEATVVELARAVESGSPLDGIAGLAWRSAGRQVLNPPRPFEEDLDRLPMPDWDLIDIPAYKDFIPHSPLLYSQPYMSVLTSRGCPYRCVYCHNIFGKKFRAHSPGRVLAEIGLLREKYKIRNFEFADDIFNLDRGRAAEILRGLAGKFKDIKLFFCNGLRADLLDRELARLLAAAGTKYASIAVETGSARLQEQVKKNLDLARLRAGAAALTDERIFVNGFFMMGFPGETAAELRATRRFLWSLPIHTCMISFCLAYAGTELGDSVPGDKRPSPGSDTGSYSSARDFVNCSDLPAGALVRAKWAANVGFYLLSPSRIYRIFRDLPFRNARVLALLFKKLLTRTVFLK
ncbi:MAG: B12-binding domain-containing radical SAM protein [Elusimicrobiales bacterium]|nr:B12-binding domain-containing radical SAM protein [Elusimicrobiales bacterium]